MRLALLLVFLVGCIRAPDVIIVDKKTALEQQAAGSFRGLEEELEQAGLLPRPTPVTAAQLAEAGVLRAGAPSDDADGLPDSLRSDALLVKRCVGESLDGTLVLTTATCTGAMDVPQTNRLIERVNRNRRQLWQWMAEKTHKGDAESARLAWRQVHLNGLVCGGQFLNGVGAWEIKRC